MPDLKDQRPVECGGCQKTAQRQVRPMGTSGFVRPENTDPTNEQLEALGWRWVETNWLCEECAPEGLPPG